jgi:hypothetical protein
VPSGPRVVRASPRRLTGAPFPTRWCGCPDDRPLPLSEQVHSLVRSLPLGVSSPASRVTPCEVTRSCPGFRPSSRRCPVESTGAEDPSLPLRSVLRFSQPLDGLLHHRHRGLVSSRSHVQGSPYRGFSRSAASPSRRRQLPPCPLPCGRSPVARLPRPPVGTSRLCSAERCVRSDSGVSLARCRSPLRLASSSRYPAANPCPGRAGCPVSARDVLRHHLRRRVATAALVSPLRLQRCPGSPAGGRVSATTDLLEVPA